MVDFRLSKLIFQFWPIHKQHFQYLSILKRTKYFNLVKLILVFRALLNLTRWRPRRLEMPESPKLLTSKNFRTKKKWRRLKVCLNMRMSQDLRVMKLLRMKAMRHPDLAFPSPTKPASDVAFFCRIMVGLQRKQASTKLRGQNQFCTQNPNLRSVTVFLNIENPF